MTPVELILSKLEGVTHRSGRQWWATCPAHDDSKHSLSIGVNKDDVVIMKCFAGCSNEAILNRIGLSFADLYPDKKEPPTLTPTVALLAWDNRLPPEVLKEHGLKNSGDGVEIPYRDAAGKVVATKRRTALTAKEGSLWPKGQPLLAYGLWRLADVRAGGRLTLVEGESDCWTLWHHGEPAIGLPGADAVKTLTAEVLQGITELSVWQEPGSGGENFVQRIANKLAELKWTGTAKVVSSPAIKDPNALHQRDPAEFKDEFKKVIAAGKPLPAPADVKKRREKPAIIVPDIVPTLREVWNGRPVPAPGFFPNTDAGNAERLVFRHGKEIRFVEDLGRWLIWDTVRWKVDKSGEIVRRAVETVRAIHAEADAAVTADKKQALTEHALDSESFRRVQAMTRMTESAMLGADVVPMSPESLDADPWLLNVKNGTVNLADGSFRPHNRTDYLTKLAQVEYDAQATCPTWLKFLDRIMDGSQELIDFLQVAVGYSATAIVSEKCFFFLYGNGDNGKSTFIEVLEDLFCDYQAKTTAETILERGQSQAVPNDIARLIGVRLVSTAELPEGRRLDEARIKDLTGRDTISARFLRREWFEFRPVFKLWMYGNHRPVIRGADDAIWKRVRLIPFRVSIPKAEQDEKLPSKLRAELPGILNWVIAGCLKWQAGGLPIPAGVKDATDDYRSEMDIMADFIADRCIVAVNAMCPCEEIYTAYADWAKKNGEYVMSQKKLGSALRSRGFEPFRTKEARGWKGISVLPKGAAKLADKPGDLSIFDT